LRRELDELSSTPSFFVGPAWRVFELVSVFERAEPQSSQRLRLFSRVARLGAFPSGCGAIFFFCLFANTNVYAVAPRDSIFSARLQVRVPDRGGIGACARDRPVTGLFALMR
jgi:hypothetical protein